MKKFFINITVFSLLFFITEKTACLLINSTPERQYDKRLESLLHGEINKDLIVLGSSRGAGNILAGQIEKETGLSSYNLSYQGSNINFHEFILKTLLAYNSPPKKLILAIDNPTEFSKDTSIRFRSDVLQPLTKYNYINTTLVNQNVNSKLSYLFCLSRLNKSHFRFKKNTQPSENPLDSFGTMPIIKKKVVNLKYNKEVKPYSKEIEVSSKIKSFKNIQDLCKQNNIELIYVFSPSFNTFNYDFYNRFKDLIKPNEKVFMYDVSKDIYRNPDYFYDNAHLLKNGAQIFTSEISTFVNANRENTTE
ncbi:hypothetical protein [Lacinutrix chionoecetis]